MSIDEKDVGWFDKGDPEHRGTASRSEMFRLVTAQLSAHENCPSPKFHLRFTLGCSTGSLTGVENQYEINLRQCIVDLMTEGCEADLSDAYSFELPDAIVEESSSFEAAQRQTIDGEGELSCGAETKGMNILGGLKFKASAKKGAKQQNIITGKRKRRVMLISCNGEHWIVGDDEYGDPRNKHGWLRERYFNEDKTKPLCAINVKKGTTEAKVAIVVRAKLGHLDVSLLDSMGRPSRKAGPQHVNDVTDALRERLKGIAVAKAFRERQIKLYPTEPLPPAEFELVRTTIIAHMPQAALETDFCQRGQRNDVNDSIGPR
jgi:hypothetical protein